MPGPLSLPAGAPRHCARLAALCGAALLACGCAEDENVLEGSLGEVVDLSFEWVEVTRTEHAVSVSYLRPHGEGRDTVFRLTVYADPTRIVGGQEIELGPRVDGSARAAARRAVTDDPVRTFADIRLGSLELSAPPEENQPLVGSFRVTFGEGGDAGKGRTALGRFKVYSVVQGE